MIVRSDRGKETVMVAAAHFWLSLGTTAFRRLRPRRIHSSGVGWYKRSDNGEPDILVDLEQPGEDPDILGPERPLQFGDCWIYGKSTKNQRIES